MKTFDQLKLLAATVAFAWLPAVALDTSGPSDRLAPVRAHIEARQWAAAVAELHRVSEPASADWNNLMGYSLRMQPLADHAAAARFYEEALRIDPKHRGALEYAGELDLITGNLPKAEERLAALDKACRFSCGEYRDLKRAIERYKAAGNRYVAQP